MNSKLSGSEGWIEIYNTIFSKATMLGSFFVHVEKRIRDLLLHFTLSFNQVQCFCFFKVFEASAKNSKSSAARSFLWSRISFFLFCFIFLCLPIPSIILCCGRASSFSLIHLKRLPVSISKPYKISLSREDACWSIHWCLASILPWTLPTATSCSKSQLSPAFYHYIVYR